MEIGEIFLQNVNDVFLRCTVLVKDLLKRGKNGSSKFLVVNCNSERRCLRHTQILPKPVVANDASAIDFPWTELIFLIQGRSLFPVPNS